MQNIYEFLDENNIKYIKREHPAIHSQEDSEKYKIEIPGMTGKNLVLRNKKFDKFFLVILPLEKRADLKKIGEIVGEKKLSFAGADVLKEYLGVEPGSVSPFGLINDVGNVLNVYIDQEIYNAPIVNFHPNINTASLELSNEMFHKFLGLMKNEVKVVEM